MLTINEINSKLLLREIKVKDLVEKTILDIKVRDEDIKAIVRFYSEDFIVRQIKIAEELIENGRASKLTGVPIIVKDNILIEGEIVSASSHTLENYTSTYTASVIENLLSVGAVLIASANMDEFAMGVTGETSYFGATHNPIDLTLVSGGSSSGPAASVSADYVAVSIGSDTGGSLRVPAAFCNVVSFKPTYGMISRYGLIAMGSSLDQIGPMANNVEDAEILYEAMASHDSKDATSIGEDIRQVQNLELKLKKKIGIPKFLNRSDIADIIDPKILADFEKQKLNFQELGYELVEIEIPNLEKSLAIYHIICPAEVSSNMGRYDGVRYGLSVPGENTITNFTNSRTEGFGDEVKRRIILGTYILSAGYFDAYYNQAVLAREQLKKDYIKVFVDVDVILTPTSTKLPWKLGEQTDPMSMFMADLLVAPANIIGAPAIAIPTTKRSEVSYMNLPTSIQLIGNLYEDRKVFKVAREIEFKIQEN